MEDMHTKGKPLRVLIVSGIFFPDVGGPATHSERIAEHLTSLGWIATVVAFGESVDRKEPYRVIRITRRSGKPLSWLMYAFAILCEITRHDVVYAFDLTTAGLPAAVFSRIFGKPFLLRIGGDPIWERLVEQGKRFLPMRSYYEQGLYAKDKPLMYRAIRFVVNTADVVVTYCDFLREIYARYYGVPEHEVLVIRNPFPPRKDSPEEEGTFTYLFAGRMVLYKNLDRVVRAFARVAAAHPHARLVLVGDGPEREALERLGTDAGAPVEFVPRLPQAELFEKIRTASVSLAPALTEFNPNFILESIALGKPALISRDNGLSVAVPDSCQFDPMDEESIFRAMAGIIDPVRYRAAREWAKTVPLTGGWKQVVETHSGIIYDAAHSKA